MDESQVTDEGKHIKGAEIPAHPSCAQRIKFLANEQINSETFRLNLARKNKMFKSNLTFFDSNINSRINWVLDRTSVQFYHFWYPHSVGGRAYVANDFTFFFNENWDFLAVHTSQCICQQCLDADDYFQRIEGNPKLRDELLMQNLGETWMRDHPKDQPLQEVKIEVESPPDSGYGSGANEPMDEEPPSDWARELEPEYPSNQEEYWGLSDVSYGPPLFTVKLSDLADSTSPPALTLESGNAPFGKILPTFALAGLTATTTVTTTATTTAKTTAT